MNSDLVNFNKQPQRDNGITVLRKEGKSVEFLKHFGEEELDTQKIKLEMIQANLFR